MWLLEINQNGQQNSIGINDTYRITFHTPISGRFANERDSLWRKVILSKFGEDYWGWCPGDINGGFGVGLWKEIRKEWPQLIQHTYLALGNGRRISFWKDVWCGEEALSLMFPN